ncbi:MAG: efflux transporter outer membrane subunit [Magnetococcus sp. YQC-5]
MMDRKNQPSIKPLKKKGGGVWGGREPPPQEFTLEEGSIRFPRCLLSFLGVVLVSGCSLTPDFPLPEPPIPNQWPVEQGSGVADVKLPVWRSVYAHPQLQEVIAAALESSRDLRAAVARMEKAAAVLGVAGSSRLPTVQGDAMLQAVRTPGDLSFTGQSVVMHRKDIGISLPAFELDFWGRLQSLEDAALGTYLANEETVRALRIVLIAQVMETYLGWRELSERIILARAGLETQQELRNLAEKRVGAGVSAAQSELRAAMAVEGSRAELAELRRQESLAYNALRLLIGETLDASIPLVKLSELDFGMPFRLAMPARVLVSRPDVRAAEYRLEAANANVGAARAAFWPRIVLTTSVGTASQELSGLFQPGSATWSFVPKLDVPIFDFSRRENELSAVKAERSAVLAEYEKVLQQAFREVADALTSRGVLLERLRAVTTARETQQARLNLIQERCKAGLDGKQELLAAQQELYATEQQVQSAQRMVLVNQVALYKALGGGVE